MVVLVLALAGGGLYWLRPDLIEQMAGQLVSSQEGDGDAEAYLHGREFFLLDTIEGFEQADREFHRAGETEAKTRAGLAEVYTTWAQYYLDEVADSRLKQSKASDEDATALKTRADIRHEDFLQKLEQARRFVEAALKNAPNAAESHRAAADYYRLTGELPRAQDHLEKALAGSRQYADALPETEFVGALLDLTSGREPSIAIGRLERVIERNDKLIRCHYRLARLYAASGEKAAALASLNTLLELNPDHRRGKSLQEALRGTAPPLVAVASATIATTTDDTMDRGPRGDGGPLDGAIAQADTDPAAQEPQDSGSSADPAEETDESAEGVITRATKLQRSGSRQACSLFRRADRMRPGNPEVLTGLAYCALDSGNRGGAIGYFRRALASSSSYGPALIGMAESLSTPEQRLEYYDRYLRAHPGGGQARIARRNAVRLREQLGEATDVPEAQPPETPTPPEAPTPPEPETPTTQPGGGTPEQPTVTRETAERPPEVHSDGLAIDSEPPLRPGEDVD